MISNYNLLNVTSIMASCQGQAKEKVYPFSAKAFLTSFVFFSDTFLEKISNKIVLKERVRVLAIATTQSSYLSYQLHLIDCCYYLSCL